MTVSTTEQQVGPAVPGDYIAKCPFGIDRRVVGTV